MADTNWEWGDMKGAEGSEMDALPHHLVTTRTGCHIADGDTHEVSGDGRTHVGTYSSQQLSQMPFARRN